MFRGIESDRDDPKPMWLRRSIALREGGQRRLAVIGSSMGGTAALSSLPAKATTSPRSISLSAPA